MFSGRIILQYDSCNFKQAADLVQRLPKAHSALERLLLRGLLIETALRWFAHANRYGSDQRADPFSSWLRDKREQPRSVFMDWAATIDRYCASSIAQQTARVVRQHSSIKMNARKVGRILGLSELAIKAAFRTEFRMTIQQYQDVTRILDVLSRLEQANHKIEPLATEVGYRSKDTFFRSFKRLTGTTPAAFRRLSAVHREDIIDRLKHILASGVRRRSSTTQRPTKSSPTVAENLRYSQSTA